MLKSGGCWVDAPSAYGPRNTLYKRFVCWTTKGVWADIFQILLCFGRLQHTPIQKNHGGRLDLRTASQIFVLTLEGTIGYGPG